MIEEEDYEIYGQLKKEEYGDNKFKIESYGKNIEKFNKEQENAFYQIMETIFNPDIEQRCFYIDGIAGTGKTFLYQGIIY